MAKGKAGQPWTDDEVRVALDGYFRMLAWQLVGIEFVKAEVRENIATELPARSKKSIELKWCNISAVLDRMDLAWVDGYKALPNIQRSLVEAVESWIDTHPDLQRKLGA